MKTIPLQFGAILCAAALASSVPGASAQTTSADTISPSVSGIGPNWNFNPPRDSFNAASLLDLRFLRMTNRGFGTK